ncbi:hypothetical protein EZV62_005043 [Acer yangbiense]|uniref:Alpha-1,3-glucosyltransferase n=1 Tax=Acer yangbiense TaxID=1000413 RepID=A0A5C7ILR4_9ROSI|nr:hypothetical protein EZV62_005043 [Acer yangbiense]
MKNAATVKDRDNNFDAYIDAIDAPEKHEPVPLTPSFYLDGLLTGLLRERQMGKKKAEKVTDDKVEVDNGDDVWWWLICRSIGASFLCISVFAILVRVAVSLHPYSGAGNPPKFGDYEAQRHWMEITLNLPAKEWYRNSTINDLGYWGLDYPPLTAYQSYVHGLFLRSFDPDSVSLFTSRGHETYLGKLLMRWTVLSSDALIFFPAVFGFVSVYHTSRTSSRKTDIVWHIAMLLLSPCLILIDHGHFQYNCISLGLTVGAVAAILSQKELVASVLFTLALNHKQMSAYFAPAFLSHLLGKCLRRKNPLLEVSKLGLVVIGTFAVIWWPYLHSSDAIFGHQHTENHPSTYNGTRNAIEVMNFLFSLEQYFEAKGARDDATKIANAPTFLRDAAQLWWRRKHGDMGKGINPIHTWEEFKKELKRQFCPINAKKEARGRLCRLKQTGSIRDYVKEFTTLTLEIEDMSEKDSLLLYG